MKMKVDNQLVDKVAELAKLEFDAQAKQKMISDMDKILSFVGKIEELDTEGVEPLIYMTQETNMLRNDEVGQHNTKEEALKNAPEKDSDYFKVPKVLNK
jgi:aspartyl-tRNA(Asn)/glutamyl-tRNA(Gln) amidotransferase subunit C